MPRGKNFKKKKKPIINILRDRKKHITTIIKWKRNIQRNCPPPHKEDKVDQMYQKAEKEKEQE